MASSTAPTKLGLPAMITQTISEYAESAPSEVALRSGTRELTYGALEKKTAEISRRLKFMGAGPDVLVGVLIERGPLMATAVLAALRAGSGYLPIDAETPAERVAFMLFDSMPRILITQNQFRAVAERGVPGLKVLYLEEECLESEGSLNKAEAGWFDETRREYGGPDSPAAAKPLYEEEPDCEGSPSSLAYVIYTSGSTGNPKGVEVTREGLQRFCAHMRHELNFNPGDVALALASVSFDVAVFELIFPLSCGGQVVILPRSTAADGRKLAEAITRYRPAVLLATPATWQILIDSGWEGAPELRAVSGGEVMQMALADQIRQRAGELWNHYGPTEATIATTTYRVRGGESKIPVGRPIAGLTLFVLDSHGSPVREGEAGELFISGPGVARGYRGDPARTAERFVRLPLALRELRAYRTGDIVRMNPDGNYEFVGRADNQVKIRGHRVELEEIEAALMRYPGITETAVIVHDLGADDRRLVAFVSLVKGAHKDASALRKFLGTQLYKFMIPAKFFFLPVLPKTVNRKIDRRALEQIAASGFDVKKTFATEVSDPVEADLLAIWRRLPGFESVGTGDSFFDYGGHSLLAVRMIKEAEDRFGVILPLATLFEAPTVKDLARVLKDGTRSRPWSPLVPIRAAGTRTPLFCVHGIGGNVLNFERLGVWLDSEQPLYGLQAAGIDHGRPLTDVEEMAKVYLEAIRQVQPSGPYLLAGYSAGGIVAFEMARQLRAAGDDVGMLILFDALMYSNASAAKGHIATRIVRKVRGPVARIGLFLRMRGEERRESFRRNWNYYWWLLGIKARTRAFLLLERMGIEWAVPGNMQDAFALAIRKYQAKAFDGRALLYRAVHGDHSSSGSEPTMGWENIVGDLSVEVCQADHLGMFYEPQVRSLAQSLNRHLREVLAE